MTFYNSLRDDLVQRSNALASEAQPRRRAKHRWPMIGLTVTALGVGGTVAVAELTRPASEIARETVGGPRGIAEGATPISLRNIGDAALWEVAAFEDRGGGLGLAASTQFDPRPANMATAGQEVLREIRENGGATVYGVVQIDADPTHVVVYGAAAPDTREVQVQGHPARFADQPVRLTAWEDERPAGPLGEVQIFAADIKLPDGLSADRVNGTFTGETTNDGTVNLLARS